MKKTLLILSILGAAMANADTTTLDFEGFDFGVSQLPSPYMGVNFSEGSSVASGYGSVGSLWSTHSGTGYATSNNGIFEGTLASGTATDFSLYYTKAYSDTSNVHLELWLNGALQASSDPFTLAEFSTNYLSMPGVEFDTFRIVETDLLYPGYYGYYAVDDVSFTTNAVPEPASMAALGLGGLALLRRRRKSA